MTQQIDAMKQALEALKWSKPHEDAVISHSEAITALEKALAQPEQEPVIDKSAAKRIATSLGWTPQRTWVGLTRRERFEIEKAMSKYYDYQHECKTVCLPEFAAAIEAKLKEKNT